jgi:catechol 2,3-dioxygenase-like lactoylglutathione lyase family enzyme
MLHLLADNRILQKPERSMKPRITMLTLGVDDLERSVKFYRDGLGFPTGGIVGKEFEHGAAAFFDLQDGLKLAVFARSDLAIDAGIPKSDKSPTEFSIGHNVRSAEEVDAIMKQAAAGGANIIKPAQRTFWGGYAGYFQDPDGHMWEVAWNSALLPED